MTHRNDTTADAESEPEPETEAETETEAEAEREQHALADGGEQEQIDPSDLNPRGEYRDEGGFVVSRSGQYETVGRQRNRYRRSTGGIETDSEPVPSSAREDYQDFFIEFAITQSALRTFDDLVLEPDWDVVARIDEEEDEDMTEALQLWGENCAIRAGEPGHDLQNILTQCPSGRRTKPAVLVEKIGTTDDPSAIAALQLIEPWNMSARLRANQNLIVQPEDSVPPDHPTVERDGEEVPAAYVQYDDSNESAFESRDESDTAIPFAEDDLLKLTYEPPEGSAWGRTIWPAIAEEIEAFRQKLRDRNAAIRLTGHPHRIYSSDSWTREEAKQYADMHDEGTTSAWDLDEERRKKSYAGRVDYVPHTVEVEVVEGEVADIADAIKDDLEQIFAVLPLSRYAIAYEDSINQFVVEPQQEKDDRTVDKERRYLEAEFGELFAEKADELADGSYEGEVEFFIRQPESDNPLERADFDPERVSEMVSAFTDFVQSGASAEFPRELPYFFAGMDREGFETEHADVPDVDDSRPTDDIEGGEDADEGEENGDEDDGVDESDEDVQEAAEQMGIGASGSD